MFYAGWNYGVRMELVGIYKQDTEVLVRQSVPPEDYIKNILKAKFCPVVAASHNGRHGLRRLSTMSASLLFSRR